MNMTKLKEVTIVLYILSLLIYFPIRPTHTTSINTFDLLDQPNRSIHTTKQTIYHWNIHDKQTETTCLAKNIYFEGRGESSIGQLAIGLVTLNRVKHESFPNTICSVVYETGHNKNSKMIAQFSWVLDSNSNEPIRGMLWHTIVLLASAMTADGVLSNFTDITNGALFYHADFIDPKWTNLTKLLQIEHHIFYTHHR